MKAIKTCIFLLIILSLFPSCEKNSESTTTSTTGTTTQSQSVIRIEVQDPNGTNKPGIIVIMSDSLISNDKPFASLESSISDSKGIAFFDMKDYEKFMPKTFYFGAIRQEGQYYILLGTQKIENVVKGKEYKSNLVLLY